MGEAPSSDDGSLTLSDEPLADHNAREHLECLRLVAGTD